MTNPPSLALIFDLDGTLVDTTADLAAAAKVVDERMGGDVTHGADASVQPHLEAAFVAYYGAHLADKSRAYPGVPATLSQLKASGARLAVLTNKLHDLAVQLLSALDLGHYFDVVLGAGQIAVDKQDPRAMRHVNDALGGIGAGVMVIGDSITDVQIARAAGVPVILVTCGYSREPSHTLGGDAPVDDFSEIPSRIRAFLAGAS